MSWVILLMERLAGLALRERESVTLVTTGLLVVAGETVAVAKMLPEKPGSIQAASRVDCWSA